MLENQKIAKRYARAFIHGKADRKKVEVMTEEMRAFVRAMEDDEGVHEFLVSPAYKRSTKIEAVKAIAEKVGFSDDTYALLELLIRKKRIEILPSIAEELLRLSDEVHDIVRVRVTTAVEPSKSDIEEIAKRITGYFGKKAEVTRTIDPGIVGGFVIEGDGRVIDMSVSGQIRKLLGRI